MGRLNRNLKVFVQQSAVDDVISGQGGELTDLVEVSSTSKRYLYVNGENYENTFSMS